MVILRVFMLLVMCLSASSMAVAQAKPPDVPNPVSWTPAYKTDGTLNTPIDPLVTSPPQAGLTNIPVADYTGRVRTGTYGPGPPFCVLIPDGGTCYEKKFRTSVDFSHCLFADPIRNWGLRGGSHFHCFFGSGSTNAFSTYKSLRKHALDSTAAGTDVNGTGYWKPAIEMLNPFADGKNYAIKEDSDTVYYQSSVGLKGTVTAPGTRFVSGFDMDSTSVATQYQWLDDILLAANTASGKTRYTLKHSGHYFNQATYVCGSATPSEVDYLVTPTGTDPHNGTCNTGQTFFVKMDMSPCWDGLNLWVSGGYRNVIPMVWDTVANNWTCPYNSYGIAKVRLEITLQQTGWTDRQRWILSSDISYRAAHSLTAFDVPAGITMHTDWMDGWDHVVFDAAIRNCAGAEGNQGRECGSSVYSSTETLIGGITGENGAGGRAPQVNFGAVSHTTQAGMVLIPPQTGGMGQMLLHPAMNDNLPPAVNDNPTQLAGVAPVNFSLQGGR